LLLDADTTGVKAAGAAGLTAGLAATDTLLAVAGAAFTLGVLAAGAAAEAAAAGALTEAEAGAASAAPASLEAFDTRGLGCASFGALARTACCAASAGFTAGLDTPDDAGFVAGRA
jgi:hypothetical protein